MFNVLPSTIFGAGLQLKFVCSPTFWEAQRYHKDTTLAKEDGVEHEPGTAGTADSGASRQGSPSSRSGAAAMVRRQDYIDKSVPMSCYHNRLR